ncbi:MAG: hypothetical protein PF505_02680 [Vallitaleaceae bacterium]|jgi:hypothetical protein|nr:hypothetical protein [Vallitaleaceae bacterium]
MKKMLTLLLALTLLFSTMAVSVSADTSEVTLTGEILTTIIDVDIPTCASFTINTNIAEGTEGRYVMPTLHIFNATTAPITLSIVGFDNKPESENQFTEVSRDDKDWASLGATESTSYIYLGITGEQDQSGFLNHTELFSIPSAVEVQSAEQQLCHIKSDMKVDLEIECQSGSAFPNAITSVYELIFVASLYEDVVEPSTITDLVVHDNLYFTWDASKGTEYLAMADDQMVTLTIVTNQPDTNYLVNGLDYFGSQTININTLILPDNHGRYITIEYLYDDTWFTKKIIINYTN